MPFKIGSTSSKPFLGSGAVKYMTVGSTLVQPDWTLPGDDTYSQFAESIARTNAISDGGGHTHHADRYIPWEFRIPRRCALA
jgi:hypothetical protein